MSIGFCVDFAAHLAYNFSQGENLSDEQRLRKALYAVILNKRHYCSFLPSQTINFFVYLF